MKMSLAQCCLPVYGDEICGYITKGEGVKVHRKDCPNILKQKERLIDVEWEGEDSERLYDSDLVVYAHDRNFLLTDIVTVVSQCKAPMIQVSATVNQETLTSTIKMKIQVHNKEQLRTIIANLRKVDSVLSIERESN